MQKLNNQRYSKQREVIYNILKNTTSHPSAEWVFLQARKEIDDISLGTVYRNLKYLSDMGAIKTVETTDGSLHYDADLSEHMHFICKECGQIADIFLKSDLKNILESQGNKVDSVKTVLYGTCSNCNEEANLKNN